MKKKKKKGFFKSFLFSVLIFLAAAAILIFIFRNNPVIYPYFSKLYSESLHLSGEGRFKSDSVSATVMYQDKLVYYDRDTLYNDDGWEYNLKMTNPSLRANGAALMACSIEEGKAEIFRDFKHLYTVKSNEKIQLSDISSSGNCVIVTDEPGYRGKVTVYDKSGKNIFRAFFGEKYVIDASLSDDGKKLGLCLFDISNDEYVSTVQFYNISEKKPYSSVDDNETAYAYISFFEDGRAMAVGDKKTTGFDGGGDALWQYSYNGASLQHFSAGGGNMLALCLKKGHQNIVCIDTDGSNYSFDYNGMDIKTVDINGDAIMAVTPRKLMFVTTRGFKIAEETITMDVKNIHMFSNGVKGLVVHNFGFESFEAR